MLLSSSGSSSVLVVLVFQVVVVVVVVVVDVPVVLVIVVSEIGIDSAYIIITITTIMSSSNILCRDGRHGTPMLV